MPGRKARLTLTSDGRAIADFAAHEVGMGTATAQMQVVADRLGIDMDCVHVNYGDSDLAGTFLAGASSQTASIGAAVVAAHKEIVEELIKLAGGNSPLHGLRSDQVESREGGIYSVADSSRGETYSAILHHAKKDQVRGGECSPASSDAALVHALVQRHLCGSTRECNHR